MKKINLVLVLALIFFITSPVAHAAVTYNRTPAGSTPYQPIEVTVGGVTDVYDTAVCGTLGGETVESYSVTIAALGGPYYAPGGGQWVDFTEPSTYGDATEYPFGTGATFDFSGIPVSFEPYAVMFMCHWSSSGWMIGAMLEYNDDNPIFTVSETPPDTGPTSTPTGLFDISQNTLQETCNTSYTYDGTYLAQTSQVCYQPWKAFAVFGGLLVAFGATTWKLSAIFL